jgi:hypothetical protein
LRYAVAGVALLVLAAAGFWKTLQPGDEPAPLVIADSLAAPAPADPAGMRSGSDDVIDNDGNAAPPNRDVGGPVNQAGTAQTVHDTATNPVPVPTAPRPARLDPAVTMNRLDGLLDLTAPNTDSARIAVDLASRLLGQPLGDSARIVVSYRLAEGLLLVGDEPAACSRLRELRPAAEASGLFVRSVAALIQRHCEVSPRTRSL